MTAQPMPIRNPSPVRGRAAVLAPRPRRAVGPLAVWALVLVVGLSAPGCGHTPAPAPWQMDAKSAMDRATQTFLEGDSRVAQAELARARRAISATGRADWLAQAELAFCAAQVASLELAPCAAFEAVRTDATPSQRAYADYLAGRATAPLAGVLPPAPHKLAQVRAGDAAQLAAQPEPLTRLVGAAVWLQQGHADAVVMDVAIDTASQQGWRRPLLAWLGLKLARAQQSGDHALADALRRRIALAGPSTAPVR